VWAVNPAKSANSTVMTLRSSVGAEAGSAGGGAAGVPTAFPHDEQNRASGGSEAEHDEHVIARGLPHCRQNLAPSGASVAQFGQADGTQRV
jgi:hypothetical protein